MGRVAPTEARGRITDISARVLSMLQAYDWPGNIRQLENAIFRATVLCEGDTLTEEEFPQIRAQVEGTVNLDRGEPEPAAAPLEAPAEDRTTPFRPAAEIRFGILKALDERGNVRSLAEVELEMIRMAIDHYNGQMSEVARRLGIGRSTLYRKLKEYGIDPETGRSEKLAS
jgi:DNA-binding NtrC family response regulator